mmetsp:Transcript_3659/g.8817  ORF Transcript_3659/g.8817 Transcript_3659/m.8817 type:complete len:239 (+) Transcript_3659:585-1301(+)
MRSMSELVHFLLITPQSLANLAHTRPSISAPPAVKLEKTSFKVPAEADTSVLELPLFAEPVEAEEAVLVIPPEEGVLVIAAPDPALATGATVPETLCAAAGALSFLTPRTSASDRSMIWLMSETLSVSMVLGPPLACTPVYRLLSSWNLFASATVPWRTGPLDAATLALMSSTPLPFFVAKIFSASSNCAYVTLLSFLSLTLANARSTSVAVTLESMILVSLQSFANDLPSSVFCPAQ